jgi:hypothetical protein
MLEAASTAPPILTDVLSIVFVSALYARKRKHGIPWLVWPHL